MDGLIRPLLSPDPVAGGNGSGAASEPSAPVPAQAPGSEPQLGLEGASPSPEAQADHWQSIVDAAREMGVEFGEGTDDATALRQLVEARRAVQQNEYFTRLGQHVAAQTLQQPGGGGPPSSQPGPAPDPVAQALAARFGYNPPPFNPQWLNMVTRDEAGNIVALPGVNPVVAQQVQEYANWREQWRNHLDTSFPQVLQAAVAPILEQFQRQVVGQFQEYQAQLLIERHRDELYQRNPQTGQREFSPLGRRVSELVPELQRFGVVDQAAQLELARRIAVAELGPQGQVPALPQPTVPGLPQTQPVPGGWQNGVPPGAYRQPPSGGHQVSNRIGTNLGRTGGPAPVASQRGRSLEEMMRAQAQANGLM